MSVLASMSTILVLLFSSLVSNEEDLNKQYVLDKVNSIRSKPCRCGSEVLAPVGTVVWSDELAATAFNHARQMEKYNFFSHRSLDGKNVGQRLDDAGYKWHYAGENLAEGQISFEEVLTDWLESPTHCRMLMNPKMKEMGIAKYGDYWVQHFGTRMPPKTVRKKVYYREGE